MVEEPQKHRVYLIFFQVSSLIKIEVIFDKAPNLFLNGLCPSKLGNLVEIFGHYLLSMYKFVMMKRKGVDLAFEIVLFDLSELFAILS